VQIVGYINTNKDFLHGQKWKLTLTFMYVSYPSLRLPELAKNAHQNPAHIVLWHAFSRRRQSILCRFRGTIYGFRSPWRDRRVAYCKELVLYIATVRNGTSGNEKNQHLYQKHSSAVYLRNTAASVNGFSKDIPKQIPDQLLLNARTISAVVTATRIRGEQLINRDFKFVTVQESWFIF